MSQQAQSPSRRLDILITLLGLLGLVLFLALYDDAFPSAAIDLTLSRDEITRQAKEYLKSRGFDVQGYEFALTFEEAFWGSAYLQRTIGVPETNRLIRDEELPLYYWRARWFRPLEKEEYSVSLAPGGSLVAFNHSIPEDQPGASLDQEQARALAEDYLTRDRAWSLADWEPVSASSQEQPSSRVDHHFEWKRRDWVVGESELRLWVDVQGDRIDTYDYWLKTPESFIRQFSEQSSRAGFINNISYYLGFFGFAAAAIGALSVGMWRGYADWRVGLRPALLVGAVSLLAGLNYLPLYKVGYSTTQDYAIFWSQRVINILFSAIFDLAIVYIMWSGGQILAKRAWPRQDKILPRVQNRWGALTQSSWRGLMLWGASTGYVVLFYLIATQLFGGWIPLSVEDASTYATPLPFLGPIRSGLEPAMTEELIFRLTGISLILMWTRRRWLALLIPGALWAFAHLAYIREPFYLRGIELTIEAVFLSGLFFLRFDLITTIVAHLAFNAGLGALPLLRSDDPYFTLSGFIVLAAIASPLLIGIGMTLRQRLRHRPVPTTPPEIFEASADDLDYLTTSRACDEDWSTALADPNALVVCLRSAGTIIGVVAGALDREGTACITTACVDPRWRRRYWGSTLVDEFTQRMRERGAKAIEVTTNVRDRASIGFWASQGWRPTQALFSKSLLPQAKRSVFRRVRDSLKDSEEVRI